MHSHVTDALAHAGVPYRPRRHADVPGPIRTPADFAAALGYPVARITKTLFLRDAGTSAYALVTCPVPAKLDLAAVTRHLGWRRPQLAAREELLARTDYPPTGVSPLGVPGVPVLLDASLFAFETVLVGGGAVGVEVELAPTDLQRTTDAAVLDLVTCAHDEHT